mgnify:CR=1 FL=1
MGSYSIVLFSLLLISSIILASNFESSFADDVIATGIGFEDSVILELKNSRGNTYNIDTVRIWLSGDNEFKSFKTEQGWMGKNTPQGVIIFTSQNNVNPGEGVKFGIKTTEQNPTINWKALDINGEVITSATTKIIISETKNDETKLNNPKNIGINDDSTFRFIPEHPSSDTDFRVVGEKFVPGQSLDFYIQNNFKQKVNVNDDGRILFTSKTPEILNDERTEFVLQGLGGNEKKLSLRIIQTENREIPEIIKLSIGNTPKDVKRGETITLTGVATPNSTITITSKHPNGDIINTSTILVGADAKWEYQTLFSPDLILGNISIEVDDGMSTILRNFNVISSKSINVLTEKTMYQPGETVYFSGTGKPNQDISISLEDAVGAEIFSRSVGVTDSGNVQFEIPIGRDAIEGTYILYLFQDDGEGITTFGVGQEPEAILILNPIKLNFSMNEDIGILIQGVSNGQVSLILIDSANREIFSESINLGPDGIEMYEISSDKLSSGAYILSAQRGESIDEARFTVGFTTGSGTITIQTTRNEYLQGEQILILGKTSSVNVLLDVTINDSNGKVIKKFETFSDLSGVFKIDNFRIPMDAKSGIWKIDAKSGSNFKQTEFEVISDSDTMIITLEKDDYNIADTINIEGSGASGSTISLTVMTLNGDKIAELNFAAKSNGQFSTIWQIPLDMTSGEYEMHVDDGIRNASIKFIINWSTNGFYFSTFRLILWI